MKRLPWFTGTLLEQLLPFEGALLMVDQIVFDVPPALASIRRAAGETRAVHEAPGFLFENDHEGFRATLEAALPGWIDLRTIFMPSRHALRADHDEFTTFFSESTGKIADVRSALTRGSVAIVRHTAEAP